MSDLGKKTVELQVRAFRQITRFQFVIYLLTGGVLGVIVLPETWIASWIGDTSRVPAVPLLLSFATVVLTYFGGIVAHELYEVNDQLAGRSPELYEGLKAAVKPT